LKNDITYDEALKLNNPIFIDVRSPKEYEEATIPGAVNIPVLLDEERIEVGTLYAHGHISLAKQAGVEAISERLPTIFREITQLYETHCLIIFCSRGGYRSTSLSSFLYALDIKVHRLYGGYKAYRHWLLDHFSYVIAGIVPVTLYGNTGAGKTLLLHQLAAAGYPVIDLEALANHRGSLLGAVGHKEQPGQKKFDSALYALLEKYQGKAVFFEGESRRIGRLLLRDEVYNAICSGCMVWIDTPIEERVKLLVAEYSPADEAELVEALAKLARYVGKNRIEELKGLLIQRKYHDVAQELCERYYDCNYKKPTTDWIKTYINDNPAKTVKALAHDYDCGLFH